MPPFIHQPLQHNRQTHPVLAPSLLLELRATPRLTLATPSPPIRSWLLAGAAAVSGIFFLLRKGYSDGVRRRVIRRLNLIAPRTRYHPEKLADGAIINSDCPVCLTEFSKMGDRPIRVLECRHALCAECLEAWAVHCTKAHLNPARFGVTRGGRVVSWTPGPKCPLCCARLNCVPKEDLRDAVIAAITQRGVALSTFIAYQSRASLELPGGGVEQANWADEEDTEWDGGRSSGSATTGR